MNTVTFKKAKHLVNEMSVEEQFWLVQYTLSHLHQQLPYGKTTSLRGTWKGKFPEDIDIEGELRDIRNGWKKEMEDMIYG